MEDLQVQDGDEVQKEEIDLLEYDFDDGEDIDQTATLLDSGEDDIQRLGVCSHARFYIALNYYFISSLF